jgi:SAM-dependent methyltransferase
MARSGNRRVSRGAKAPEAPRARAQRPTLAARADRHECYERAVQAPEVDARFIDRSFRQYRGRVPRVLREDFCGSAALCAEWVKLRGDRRAIGIDLDAPTLNWGIARHLLPLGARAARVDLICQDVRDPVPVRADVAAAFNFSYFIFRDRAMMRRYFAQVYKGLARDGIFYLDLFGGPESIDVREERTAFEKFTYVWDQAAFNPVTHDITCHIHFEFRDHSTIRRAFTYQWRMWMLPELREIALEAGFRDFIVYWEGTDGKTGEGNGIYRPSRKGDNSPAFICYMLCLK